MTWAKMMPEVVQQIQADNASGLIMLGILNMVVGFGIFGTILMMLNERLREFGMIIAIGMQRIKLISIVITEMLLLGTLGILAGILFDIPLIYYFHSNPISLTGDVAKSTLQMGFDPVMPAARKISYFLNQSLIIFIIILLILIFPVVKLTRFKIIDALSH
jgi:putative ABC transport system permease protein